MKERDFLTLKDINEKELMEVLNLSIKLKRSRGLEWQRRLGLRGKVLVMLFAKTSTRTRVSFETAMHHLGGHAINLNWKETNFVKGDITDEAKVLGLYCDTVMARLFDHDQMEQMAKGCDKPVINGMDDLHHPCQALADLLTILEVKGRFEGLKIGWVGDGTNVCNSLMEGADMVGARMIVATPQGYEPRVKTSAELVRRPEAAAKEADVLVTDSWVSIGLEKEKEERLKVFKPYQLNSRLVSLAKKDCIILHCLPAQRGYEITSEVLDSLKSKVFQEAENRLHTEKALLLNLL
ncbi:MAG: ornithine carbamoyltransferase [Candidatus Bathyarchaeota archaeon]